MLFPFDWKLWEENSSVLVLVLSAGKKKMVDFHSGHYKKKLEAEE